MCARKINIFGAICKKDKKKNAVQTQQAKRDGGNLSSLPSHPMQNLIYLRVWF
jgi:hypothetical protein